MCPNGDGDAQSHSSTTIRRKAKPAHSRLNILEQVLTLKGRLDTSNGKWQGDIKLRKKVIWIGFGTGTIRSRSRGFEGRKRTLGCMASAASSTDKCLPQFFADSKFPLFTRADVGASYSTKSDEVLYGLKAKKCIELSPDGLLSLDVKGGYQMAAALPTTKKVREARAGRKCMCSPSLSLSGTRKGKRSRET